MNHAQEAADMLDGTNPHGSPQEALAHATLALVEQQRLTAASVYMNGVIYALTSGTAPNPDPKGLEKLAAIIKDGFGI